MMLDELTTRLSDAGFIAAKEEAQELLDASNGDDAVLTAMLERRLNGEPLAWIVGFASFCGLQVKVDPGVYVPRWQSEPLAHRAASKMPKRGVAIDLCTGSGALAMTLRSLRRDARVVASDLDERAVACAISNGVEAYRGDLFEPLPRDLEGTVDVIVGVVPYVPTNAMSLLARDTLVFESILSYDGGADGTEILRRVVSESPRYLRAGGALLLELGGDQAEFLADDLARSGFENVVTLLDEDGDVRGIEALINK